MLSQSVTVISLWCYILTEICNLLSFLLKMNKTYFINAEQSKVLCIIYEVY